ncbi:uncharacterized protein LOC111081357 [Drosophila obscura]|uniref:uncharacterized protein LOC111081357 n=1 Tax=Drosophila obscura TaxID=7282 RepID=UPI001BB11624|nr:uncharacterized protein LOC111081357 [Drosophila obscura]
MTDLETPKVLLKPILILRDAGSGGDGMLSTKAKKNVTFKRVVEYYTYSDNLKMRLEKTSLLPDENLNLSGVDIPTRRLSEEANL